MPKLGICWIWTSPFVWSKSVASMLKLRRPAGYEVDFFQGRGWSPACRHNHACEQAVAWDADHILILGADQVYEPDLLERLLARREAGCEVVAALVPTRGYIAAAQQKPFQRMAWRIKGNGTAPIAYDRASLEIIDPKAGDLQRIDLIGSGCLLFDRDHLLALRRPWFFETINPETQQRVACMDTKFSFRLGWEAFARLWCDTTIKVRHLHDMEIDESYEDRFDDWMAEGGDVQIMDRRDRPMLALA
jgi:hypothetical protein